MSHGYAKRNTLARKAFITCKACKTHVSHMLVLRSHSFLFCSKPLNDIAIDISSAAQIQDIKASFLSPGEPFDLPLLKHPNKPGLTAVESYDILPDTRFGPIESDGDHVLAYYLR